MAKELQLIEIRSRAEWRAWLEANHTEPESVGVITYRNSAGDRYVSYEDVVEEALCFGWIDSTRRKLDEKRTVLLVAPRKRGSGWSRVNKERIERLIVADQMTSAGLEKIEAAKADGSWLRYDEAEALAVPKDLQQALDARPDASQNFSAFPPSSRRNMLQ